MEATETTANSLNKKWQALKAAHSWKAELVENQEEQMEVD